MSHYTSHGHYRVDSRFIKGPWARQVGVYGIAVYNVLVCFAGNDSHEAWPSYQTIADLAGCSRRTVISSIASLEKLNLIRRCRQRDGQGWRSNRYILLPPEQWRQPEEDGRPQGAPDLEGGSGAPECVGAAPDRAQSAPPGIPHAPARSEAAALPCAAHALPRTSDAHNGKSPALTVGAAAAPELTPLFLTNNPCSDEHGPTPPVNALKRRKKRRPKAKDPPVEACRTVTGRYPPLASEPLILDANINSEADLAFWREVIRHWIACGWGPQNLKGMLDCFQDHWLPSTQPAGGFNSQRRKGRIVTSTHPAATASPPRPTLAWPTLGRDRTVKEPSLITTG